MKVKLTLLLFFMGLSSVLPMQNCYAFFRPLQNKVSHIKADLNVFYNCYAKGFCSDEEKRIAQKVANRMLMMGFTLAGAIALLGGGGYWIKQKSFKHSKEKSDNEVIRLPDEGPELAKGRIDPSGLIPLSEEEFISQEEKAQKLINETFPDASKITVYNKKNDQNFGRVEIDFVSIDVPNAQARLTKIANAIPAISKIAISYYPSYGLNKVQNVFRIVTEYEKISEGVYKEVRKLKMASV